MIIIGLFFPSFIALAIYRKRSGGASGGWQSTIIRFGVYVLINTWITQALLTYLLGQGQIVESALTSFPFFTKYVAIASVLASVMPYIEEAIRKGIGVSVEFSKRSEK